MKALPDILYTDVEILLTGGKIPPKKLALISSQLAITLQAGLPLVASLALAAENQSDRHLKQLLNAVADDVREGQPLSRAFRHRAPQLPPSFLETIRAGEASGQLDTAFRQLRDYYETSAAISSKVRSAMAYPALLSVVAVVVVVVILLYAVPVFESSFAKLGSRLPLPTRILISISDFLNAHSLLLVGSCAVAAMALILFCKTQPGRRLWDWFALTLPGFGKVNRMHSAAQFAATLGAMYSAGLSLPESARVCADAVGNVLIGEEIRIARQGVLEGQPLSQGLQRSKYLPRLLLEMTAVGEETGKLEETLAVVAAYYSREVDAAVKTALALLEPCLTLLLALIVVFILLAVYLPLFSMYGFM